MGDRSWLVPSVGLTAVAALIALALMPVSGLAGPPPFFAIMPGWLSWSATCLLSLILFRIIRMMRAGEQSPLARVAEMDWGALGRVYLGVTLAGVNLITYMWLKPQLNYIAPFWADAPLARIDAWILGDDGWRILGALNIPVVADSYNPLWFFALVPTLIYLFIAPPSRARSAAIIAYFLLWSLFGPIGQYLFSAAGPLFYADLGLGGRYGDIEPVGLVALASRFLWRAYTEKKLIMGAGISAMPSLHIATAAWAVIAFASLRSRFTPLVALVAVYLWAGSVALGWHYFTDGLVGAAMAAAAFALSMLWLRRTSFGTRRQGLMSAAPAEG